MLALWWILTILSIIYVAYDVAKNKRMSDGKKAGWIILAAVIGIIGAIIYAFVNKSGKRTSHEMGEAPKPVRRKATRKTKRVAKKRKAPRKTRRRRRR